MIAPDTLLQNRYLVRERIGQGGMGAVYIATDQRFGSTVALKETFFDDPSLRKAFEREARLLNHLRHHALPRVSDHFSEDEGQFLVMEYIPGEDLSDMLQKRGGAFPLADVLPWADQLLDALDYLHTQEHPVIHRDIKPQNLKLTARNQIVLLDFGLAKGTLSQTRVTATGSVFGYSRNYAPLEQMHGTGTDTRSDLYSLAATLYHLLTGVTPPDALTRATAVLNGQPDPLRPASEVHAQVPEAVAEVLTRAMSQNAAQRPRSAEEMRAALREAGRQPAEGARGAASASTRVNASAATTDIQDQETRLLGAARAGAYSTAVGTPADTEHARAGDAATVMNAPTLLSRTAASADRAAAAAEAASASADSIVTRVAPAQPSAASPKHGLPGRTLGALASVLLLVAVAGTYYAYTRGTSPAPPAVRAPAVDVPPAVTVEQAPPPQPSADVSVGAAQPTEQSAPPPLVIIKQPQQPSAPAKVVIKRGEPKPNETERTDAEEPDVPEPPDVDAPDAPGTHQQGVDWTNPAQRERALRRIRRAAREQQMQNQREMLMRQREMQERRRRRLPPPPE